MRRCNDFAKRLCQRAWRSLGNSWSQCVRQQYVDEAKRLEGQVNFTAGHFSEPNVLAHYRTNDRVIDGKKTLFLEEVQSDWHQKGGSRGMRANPPLSAEQRQALDQESAAIGRN